MGFAVTSYADGAVGILSASIISLDQGLNSPDAETALDSDNSASINLSKSLNIFPRL